MLLHQLAEAVVRGDGREETCRALGISGQMYEWLTGNDGFQLALERARTAGLAGLPSVGNEGDDHARN